MLHKTWSFYQDVYKIELYCYSLLLGCSKKVSVISVSKIVGGGVYTLVDVQ